MEPLRDEVVHASALTKTFAGTNAVDGIDLSIRRGEVFGFLGPNGAGKTSTMRMIACMSPRSSGDLLVRGLDPTFAGPEIRAGIGLVPQEDALDSEMSVFDNLVIYGRYFGLARREVRARAQVLLEFAQLADRASTKVDHLSGGMRRRLAIARSLISRPELVILDEPTTGLDPQARHLVWDRLFQLRSEGVTLIITTHYMDEAEQLCDRLVVMDRGRIVGEGTPRELIASTVPREVVELRLNPGATPALLVALKDHVERVEQLADRICCYGEDGDAILEAVIATGIHPLSSLVRRATLEDVFLALTGRQLIE